MESRVRAARRSLRKAIDTKCRDCIYDPQSGFGGWREQVGQCTSVDCPLWAVRTGPESGPYQRSRIDAQLARGAKTGARTGKLGTLHP